MPKFHSAIVRLSKAFGRNTAPRHSAAPLVETMEGRQMLSASLNSSGNTVITPSPGARVIYVSSSGGNDGNSGLSPSAPVRTLARGISMLRGNSADELLLKSGDTWYENFGYWNKNGLSPSQPLVLGAYGSGARPTLQTGNNPAFTAGGGSLNNVDIIGLRMIPGSRSGVGPDGITVDSTVNGFVVENCDIEGYKNDISFQQYYGPMYNITIRKCVIANAWSGGTAHSQGLFADGVHGLTLVDNVFDHDGWNFSTGAWMTLYNHDCYVTGLCSGLTATGNIFANASNYGLEARCGGIVSGNLFYNDANGLSFGLVNGATVTAGGVSGSITNNVFIGTHAIGTITQGAGISLANVNSAGVNITGNVFENMTTAKVAAIQLGVGGNDVNGYAAVGLNNVNITGNVVYNWYEGIYIQPGLHAGSGPYGLNGLHVSGNPFISTYNLSTGGYYAGVYLDVAGASAFPGIGRTLGGYASSIGAGSSDTSFFAAADKLSEQTWNPALTAAGAIAYLKA